jgi:tRNA-Thr(GGU) m(6)t(6)A37 methyltransferase TsaA
MEERVVLDRSIKESGKLTFIGVVGKNPSEVRIYKEYCPGLNGLNRFSHIIILYWFHLRDTSQERRTLEVTPKRHPGAPQVGVFSSRSPSRPNPIGHSVVELKEIKDCTLIVEGLDAAEGSPIIDIKPYLPRADSIPNARTPEWTREGPST